MTKEYPRDTGWQVKKKTFYISSDESRKDNYTVVTRMVDGVEISILPTSGEVSFRVSYPFDNISEAEKEEMIARAKAKLPSLIPPANIS